MGKNIAIAAPKATVHVYHRRRQHVTSLLAAGFAPSAIIQQTGYPARTVRYIAQQYRTLGAAAGIDGRRRTQMTRQLLSDLDVNELQLALRTPPADGRQWNGPLVAEWIAARTGQRVSRQRGWDYLRRFSS